MSDDTFRKAAERVVEEMDRIAALEVENARLRAWKSHVRSGGCFAAHPGEITLECDIKNVCPACRADAAESALAALVEGCEGLDTYTQEVACLYREEGGEWIRRDELTALLAKVKEQRK